MTTSVTDRPTRSLSSGVPLALLANDFGQRLIESFDELLEPFFTMLDEFDSYLDPRLAPDHFVPWLAEWVAFSIAEGVPAELVRARFGYALDALLWVGTRRGISSAVRAYTGVEPQVEDNGGVGWATRPGGPLPGEPVAFLRVVVRDVGGELDRDLLERVVGACKPAHVPHQVVVRPA